MDFWLYSAERQYNFDFYIITNNHSIEYYSRNIKFIYTELDDLRERFQAYFEFPIVLNQWYKSCDYRPAYGELFDDILDGYDFWGHCDLDMIFGQLSKFITEEVLDNYDIIGRNGRFTIYRNCEEVNAYYRTLDNFNRLNYKDVFSSSRHFAFDEVADHSGGGISRILEDNGKEIYDLTRYDTNIHPFYARFNDSQKLRKVQYLLYSDGILKSKYEGRIEEIPFVHFGGKREMIVHTNSVDHYFINAPGVFEDRIRKHLFYIIKHSIVMLHRRNCQKREYICNNSKTILFIRKIICFVVKLV